MQSATETKSLEAIIRKPSGYCFKQMAGGRRQRAEPSRFAAPEESTERDSTLIFVPLRCFFWRAGGADGGRGVADWTQAV